MNGKKELLRDLLLLLAAGFLGIFAAFAVLKDFYAREQFCLVNGILEELSEQDRSGACLFGGSETYAASGE